MGFFKSGSRGTQLYMRSDTHGERAQKVYALDYCAASFVTEGKKSNIFCFVRMLRVPSRDLRVHISALSPCYVRALCMWEMYGRQCSV